MSLGNEEHSISLTTASAWTANYRATISSGDTLGHYFSKSYLETILGQTGCVGIRIYYALDTSNVKHLVITGVNSSGNDLYTGILAERSLRNPPEEVADNPLNS